MRWWQWPVLGGSVVCIIIGLVLIRTHLSWDVSTPVELRLHSRTYGLETATTDAAQQKGLGDRSSMPADHGMLFVFSGQAQHCFWMKDMHFSLDIIWAGSDKKVTAIEPDLSPATYPQTYCHTGQYVIELNAGTAQRNRLTVGQKLNF